MPSTPTRRRLLSASAAGCAIGLAGCLGTRDGPVPAPAVTDDRIEDGWRLVDESSGQVFEDDVGPVTVRALEHTRVYEHVGVAEALADAFDAEGSPVMFFASRIDLRPAVDGLPFGLGRQEVMEQVESAAEETFRAKLRVAGVDDVERTAETTIEVDTGYTADLRRYAGRFAVDAEVTVRTGVTETVSDAVAVEGQLATWHDGTDALVSGGVYPGEPIDDAVEDSIEAESVDLADVVDDDTAESLSRDPAGFEEDVTALLTSVE